MNRLLRLILLCLLASLALAVAACGGGGDGDEASSDTDVDTLLADTFNGKDKKIESGELKFLLDIDAKNTEGVSGPITLSITGPFQSRGQAEAAEVRFRLRVRGRRPEHQGGA